MNRELAQFAEAYYNVKGHPCTSKPAGPIVCSQQKNTANDCEKFSGLDPNPIRCAAVTEVNNKTADTHDKIKAGNQDHRDGNLVTAHSLRGFRVLTQGLPRGPRGADEPRAIAKPAGCDGNGS